MHKSLFMGLAAAQVSSKVILQNMGNLKQCLNYFGAWFSEAAAFSLVSKCE